PSPPRRLVVPADVNLLLAVQPRVNEIGRHVLHVRPLPRGVRDDHRHVMFPQPLYELDRLEGRMPHLHRVPHRPILVDARPRPPLTEKTTPWSLVIPFLIALRPLQ